MYNIDTSRIDSLTDVNCFSFLPTVEKSGSISSNESIDWNRANLK